ncbi:MAG: hypothetical protein ACI4KB_10905 [Oscillospiraceae bacterium]|nr:hypothetical protein [Oscillospiraceae bacterium]
MKRIIAALISFSVIFMFASCSSEKNSSSLPEKAVVTESAETTEVTEVTEVTTEEEPVVTVIYDFKGLDSEKSVSVLTSDKYHIRFRCNVEGQFMYQDVYFDTDDIIVGTEYLNTKYSVLFKDQVQYTIIDDIYYRMPSEEPEKIGTADMFEGYGYIGSGKTELDGKTYKYDEFYQDTTKSTSQFLLDEKNELCAIISGDKIMYIEICDSDFNSDEIICVPKDAKEVSAEEFNTQFLEKVAGNTAADENSESGVPETESEA